MTYLPRKACYTTDLNGGFEWCATHKVAFQHELCPGAEAESAEADRARANVEGKDCASGSAAEAKGRRRR